MKDLKVVFMGTPDFSVPILEMLIENTNVVLVVTQPDAPVGRKKVLTPSPVRLIADANNIPVKTPEKIRNEYEEILNYHPDIIITCAYGQIIPKVVLDYPEYGCINVHASLLPKYRGASPISKCIYNGETKTGITIMYMDEGIDTGNIIHAREIEIAENDTLGTLSEKLSHLGAKLLLDTLPKIIEGENFDIPQDNEEATYVGLIKREDERLDFNRTRKEIINHIRSLNPAPLANTIINGEEWKILEAVMGPDTVSTIGKIENITKKSFDINCSDGKVTILKVKKPGKKEMEVSALFNGYDANLLKDQIVGDNNG